MERIFINIERYITKEIPYVLFKPDSVIYTVSNAPLFDWLIGLLTICIIVFGFYKQKHFRHLLLTYLGLFCGMLIIWPEIWYGTRFILPIVPFIIFYFVSGIKILLSWLVFKMSLKTKKIGST